jgi:nitrogen fixation protein NifU and related proteins
MLADQLKGRTLEEAQRLLRGVKSMFRGEALPADLDLGDLEALRGVKDLPVRVKCALLAWTTLEEALDAGPAGPDEEDHHGHDHP